MAKRYVFPTAGTVDLAATVAASAPGSVSYEAKGLLVAVVPDLSVVAFELALPGVPSLTEIVPEGTAATLMVQAPDHLLEALRGVVTIGQATAAIAALLGVTDQAAPVIESVVSP
jgi:hypothetical protein